MTYRLASHGAADPEKYRSKDEVASWRDRDPLVLLEHRLREGGAMDDAAVEEIAGGARDEVAAALDFADASEPPPIEDLYTDVYAGADEYLGDRKSTRLNSSHDQISYAVFCLKKKKKRVVSRKVLYSIHREVRYYDYEHVLNCRLRIDNSRACFIACRST